MRLIPLGVILLSPLAGLAHPPPRRPGVKPHYVKCDPAHPERPCTPDGPHTPVPVALEPRGVKPHSVKCDPAHPERPCTPEPKPLERVPNAVTPLTDGLDAQTLRGCTADADCALTCLRDDRCCPTPCLCDAAYNQAFLRRLAEHHSGCALDDCPQAECPDPGYDLEPACVDGLCTAKRVPYAP